MWSFDRFGRSAAYDVPIALNDAVSVTFIDAGHILGCASIVVDIGRGDALRRLVFSSDIGGTGHPIVRDPTPRRTRTSS